MTKPGHLFRKPLSKSFRPVRKRTQVERPVFRTLPAGLFKRKPPTRENKHGDE